jgi:hypothetical protein
MTPLRQAVQEYVGMRRARIRPVNRIFTGSL